MKVTIITVSHNSAQTIQDTINSVRAQNYSNIEYIIIDGNSSDSTKAILRKNTTCIHEWVSEEDRGIYDAMNKGLEMATGDIIAFLNADDFFTYPGAVKDMVKYLKKENAASCYADLAYVDSKNTEKVLRKWVSGEYSDGMFLKGWMPPHPTFFVKKEVYQKYGGFKLDLGTAADYEIMLRFLHKHKISVAYLPKTIIKMRAGGVSNASLWSRLKANHIDRKAWKVNGLKPKLFTIPLKPLRKIVQYM